MIHNFARSKSALRILGEICRVTSCEEFARRGITRHENVPAGCNPVTIRCFPTHMAIDVSAAAHSSASNRVWLTLEVVLLALLLAYLCGRTLPRAWATLNTDFPNYYVTAHLVSERYSTSRIYEWTWIQRQKNRLGVDQPVVGFIPLTPTSSLPFLPLAGLPPLTAKHVWTIASLAMLAVTIALLRSLAVLGWRELLLLTLLSFPVHRNLLLGQAHVLLLLVMTSAFWLYSRGWRAASGAVIGIGVGLKIFPALFFLYFLRKRDVRAAVGLALAIAAIIAVSVAVFGAELNRTYATQVLPSALHGESLDPYNLGAESFPSLLHHLFIAEPQLNPHPLANAPWLFAVLLPVLQLVVFAPAVLLATPRDMRPPQLTLEWSSFIAAMLAISTMSAFYHFALLLLPIALVSSTLLRERRYGMLFLALILYVAVGLPLPRTMSPEGWKALPVIPRLYLALAFCGLCFQLLRERGEAQVRDRGSRRAWAAVLALGCLLEIASTLRHQRGFYDNYGSRISLADSFMASHPVVAPGRLLFTVMTLIGYRSGEITGEGEHIFASGGDELSQAALYGPGDRRLVEVSNVARNPVISEAGSGAVITNGESPVTSADGRRLAWLRPDKGRGRLWIRDLKSGIEQQLTPNTLDVLEATFTPRQEMIFSARSYGLPELYAIDLADSVRPLGIRNARFPAVSPDGEWLAFSKLEHGVWHLFLMSISSGKQERLTDADCNDMEPAWDPDSRTVVYATDCGRGLWLTALCRRRVVP